MDALATVESLQAGWRELDSAEIARAETLIKRASAFVIAACERNGVVIDVADEIQMINVESVCCNVVRRCMDRLDGVASMSQGIGATSGQITYANPDASFYLTKGDKELLGLIGKNRYRSIEAETIADRRKCCTGNSWVDDFPCSSNTELVRLI